MVQTLRPLEKASVSAWSHEQAFLLTACERIPFRLEVSSTVRL
jgi:hypothetical protein